MIRKGHPKRRAGLASGNQWQYSRKVADPILPQLTFFFSMNQVIVDHCSGFSLSSSYRTIEAAGVKLKSSRLRQWWSFTISFVA